MEYFKDIFHISQTLEHGKELVNARKWQLASETVNRQRAEAESYDAKAVVEATILTKRRISLQNAFKLVEAFKWRFESEVKAPISGYEEALQEHTGMSNRMIAKTLDKLCQLRVLDRQKSSSFKMGIACEYSFNRFIYVKLTEYFKKNYGQIELNFKSKSSLSIHMGELCGENDKDGSLEFDESRIKICKRMRMDITGISLSRIEDVLCKKYPQFLEGKAIADELNKTLPEAERIIWQWNLELARRKDKTYLTKIGFRASSKIVSYKEHDNGNPFYTGKWRRDYLAERLGDEYKHWDANGSIWRLSYNLVHDQLMSRDVDAYSIAHGEPFLDVNQRDLYKRIAMRLYFGGVCQLGVQVENKFKEIAEFLGEAYEYDKDRRNNIDDIMVYEKCNAISNIGAFFDSEIFLHESYIYLMMFRQMKTRCDVVQVYDSLYYKSDDELDMNELYESETIKYKSKYNQSFNYYVDL